MTVYCLSIYDQTKEVRDRWFETLQAARSARQELMAAHLGEATSGEHLAIHQFVVVQHPPRKLAVILLNREACLRWVREVEPGIKLAAREVA